MKNNKIVSIALLIILCLGFTACNSVETYKPIDPDAYVILHVPSEGSKSEIELGYESIDEYGFYTRSEDKVFDELKGKTIKNPFNADSVLEYKSSDCALKTADGNEYGSFYSIYDVYNSEEEELTYLHGTNTFCGYFYRENVFFEPNITLTKKNKSGKTFGKKKEFISLIKTVQNQPIQSTLHHQQ